MIKRLIVVSATLIAFAASARIIPETKVFIQTQLYPHREQTRGFLCKYVTQPLYVLQELPEDPNRDGIPDLPHWGTFSSQADYNTTMSLLHQYGVDGPAFFVSSRPRRFYSAGADCSVPDLQVAPILVFWEKNISNEFKHIRTVLSNPRALKVGDKFVCLAYETGHNCPPEMMAERIALIKKEFGDRFIFFAGSASITDKGSSPTKGDQTIRDLTRRYLRVMDGIQVEAIGFISQVDHGERVFGKAYYQRLLKAMSDVVNEPEFKGKKYLSAGAGLGHMNAYRHGHGLAEDGTRTLRSSMEVSMSLDPDFILMPEWDELNENTCLCPTLYGARTTMRIMRYYMAQIKKRPVEPLPGDDATVPNLIVSYRKSLDFGERLNVEVLNVPDSTRTGKIGVAVELLDENDKLLRSFDQRVLNEEKLDETRFETGTASFSDKMPRAVRVKLILTKDGKPLATYLDGFHPVDINGGGSFNHICVKQPLRDFPSSTHVASDYRDGRFAAKVQTSEPIRYAMVCGNGWIQYIKGRDDSLINAFREDKDHAVFLIDVFRLSQAKKKGLLKFSLDGVSEARWRYWHDYHEGTLYNLDFIGDGAGPTLYLRIPKAELKTAQLTLKFGDELDERLSLQRVFDLGAYSVGKGGMSMQVTLARFCLQAGYPHALNENMCKFVVPVLADRPSTMYHLQFVTMSGHVWFSRPFVVEDASEPMTIRVYDCAQEKMANVKVPAARVPNTAWDFSPEAGNVLRTVDGYRHWWGILGGAQSSASLWNKGKKQEGAVDYSVMSGEPVPMRQREADGSWSLVFDGKDDFASFSSGTLSSHLASTISLRIFPERDDVEETILSTRGTIQYLVNGPEGLVVGTSEMAGFRRVAHKTGLKFEIGQWNLLELRMDGEKLTVVVNGKKYQTEMTFPGSHVAPVAFGRAWDNKHGIFKGRIADFSVKY